MKFIAERLAILSLLGNNSFPFSQNMTLELDWNKIEELRASMPKHPPVQEQVLSFYPPKIRISAVEQNYSREYHGTLNGSDSSNQSRFAAQDAEHMHHAGSRQMPDIPEYLRTFKKNEGGK